MEYKIHSEHIPIYTSCSSDTQNSSQISTAFTYPTLDCSSSKRSQSRAYSYQMPSPQISSPNSHLIDPACKASAKEKSTEKNKFHAYASQSSLSEAQWGAVSQRVVCPFCNEETETKAEKSRTGMAWSLCCAMCVVGLWPCCLIPLYCKKWKTTVHKCPHCHIVLGRHVE